MTDIQRSMCYLQTSDYLGVAFVFACPGRYEETEGRPCSGATGRHLEIGLAELNEKLPDLFPSPSKLKYAINNSWPNIEFKSKTGRYLPSFREILDESNIQRLLNELRGIHYVICCGQHATRALAACVEQGLSCSVISVRHLSQRSINKLGSTNSERILNWSEKLVLEIRRAQR